jgi:hypothetical protein
MQRLCVRYLMGKDKWQPQRRRFPGAVGMAQQAQAVITGPLPLLFRLAPT